MPFRVAVEAGKLNLYHGKEILIPSISPVLRLEGRDDERFGVDSLTEGKGADSTGEYVDYSYRVELKSGGIHAVGSFRCYPGSVVAFLGIESSQHWADTADITLKAVGGMALIMPELPGIQGFMGNYLHKEWWTRPFIGKGNNDLRNLPARTQSLVWERGGVFVHILPICGGELKSELMGIPEGLEAYASAYTSGISNVLTPIMAISVDADPFEASKTAVAVGLAASGSPAVTRERRRYPEVLEYLGWCTWDAFYQEVNEAGVMGKVAEFEEKRLPVQWFIIDDGWSDSAGDYCLNSFGAHPVKFPDGLAPVITRLKSGHGLKWVGVWHAFSGYWNGIWPDGPVAKENPDCIYRTGIGKLLPAPEASKAFKLWDKWHSLLKGQGVDFVKVDFQSSLMRTYKGNLPVARVARELHSGLEASVGKNFDNAMINCMGMASENLWNRPISGISRYSDDFFPKEKDSVSEHVLQNAYNAFYNSPFIWGDWDMWWSEPAQGVNHGVLRAISGGPVYVSDPVGTTDASKIWPLILRNGRVLRCDQPGLPTIDCLTVDTGAEGLPMKLWNTKCGTGYIAAFNVDSKGTGGSVTGKLTPMDIPAFAGCKGIYAVYGRFSRNLSLVDNEGGVGFDLAPGGVELFTVAPVEHGVALLGLMDKYIGMGAVERVQILRGKATMTLKEGGTLGFVCDAGVGIPEVRADGALVGINAMSFPDTSAVLYTADICGTDITVEIVFKGM